MMRFDDAPEFGPTIHGLVENWAAATPSAPAVSTSDRTMTYGELNARADRLASVLHEHGVRPESRVGVVIPRSAEAVIAFLGILKAGGAYVPLDPAYPASRRAFMLADSEVMLLVTVASVGQLVEPGPVPVVVLDGDEPEPAPMPDPGVTQRHCAYVMYTSGSTGRPKGVMVEHRSVVALLSNDDRLAIAPGQTVAQLAPTGFDASVFEIWGALCSGARLAILPGSGVSIEDLGGQLRAWRPDWLFLTTGLFHLLVDFDLAALSAVGCLVTGGDVLDPDRVRAAAATTMVYAAYGPTETTVFTSLHAASPTHQGSRVPLGRCLVGVRVQVLDERLDRVSDGEIGELYIAGSGLARGYHGRPELTAERFLTDPHTDTPGARMYRTGDRGRILPDGELEFHGRTDRQLKVRGFRIEPGEIEHVLRAAPEVTAAVVVAIPGLDGDKRLAAYVAARAGAGLAVSDLRDWATERLPGHAVPAIFIILDNLPLDAHGKLDQHSLPAAWGRRDAVQGLPPYQAPSSEIEWVIAQAWAEVLELDYVGAQDEFYALGGDSLRSVTLLERLRANGVKLTAAEFFSNPTVAELAFVFEARHEVPTVTAAASTPLVAR